MKTINVYECDYPKKEIAQRFSWFCANFGYGVNYRYKKDSMWDKGNNSIKRLKEYLWREFQELNRVDENE